MLVVIRSFVFASTFAFVLALAAPLGGCAGHGKPGTTTIVSLPGPGTAPPHPPSAAPAASALATAQAGTVTNTISCPTYPACLLRADKPAEIRIIERLAQPCAACPPYPNYPPYPPYLPYPACPDPACPTSGTGGDSAAMVTLTQAMARACDARVAAVESAYESRLSDARRSLLSPIELRLGQWVAYLGSPVWPLLVLLLLIVAAVWTYLFGARELWEIWRGSKEFGKWKARIAFVILGIPLLIGSLVFLAAVVIWHGVRDVPGTPVVQPTAPAAAASAALVAAQAENQVLRVRLATAEGTVAWLRDVHVPSGSAHEADRSFQLAGRLGFVAGVLTGILAGMLACLLMRRDSRGAAASVTPLTDVATVVRDDSAPTRAFAPKDASLLRLRAQLWLAELRGPVRALARALAKPLPPSVTPEAIDDWLKRCRAITVELNDRLLEIITFCDGVQPDRRKKTFDL